VFPAAFAERIQLLMPSSNKNVADANKNITIKAQVLAAVHHVEGLCLPHTECLQGSGAASLPKGLFAPKVQLMNQFKTPAGFDLSSHTHMMARKSVAEPRNQGG